MLLLLCLLISFFCFWVLKENNGSLSATYVTWPAGIDCRFDSEGSLSSQGRKHGRPSQDKHLSLIQLARAPRVALQFIRGYHRPPFHRNGGGWAVLRAGQGSLEGHSQKHPLCPHLYWGLLSSLFRAFSRATNIEFLHLEVLPLGYYIIFSKFSWDHELWQRSLSFRSQEERKKIKFKWNKGTHLT